VQVRRPRLDYESHAIGLDRNEIGALLVAAGLGPAIEHALISPLALNGLRVSEATGANIDALGLERGHRTLTILRKGGKIVTIPLAPSNGPSHRPGHRRAPRGPDLHRRRRQPPRPARRRSHRPPGRPPGRDHQTDRTSHPASRLHHRHTHPAGPPPRTWPTKAPFRQLGRQPSSKSRPDLGELTVCPCHQPLGGCLDQPHLHPPCRLCISLRRL
jgi:hypothetical protein